MFIYLFIYLFVYFYEKILNAQKRKSAKKSKNRQTKINKGNSFLRAHIFNRKKVARFAFRAFCSREIFS